MRIVNVYNLNGGLDIIQRDFQKELGDIMSSLSSFGVQDIQKINNGSESGKNETLYSPHSINKLFKYSMNSKLWEPERIRVITEDGYKFREVDFYDPESKICVEMQLGKYSFMAYDIFSKFPIFQTHGLLDVGIEIVPSNNLKKHMHKSIGDFDQLVYDIESMGPHCHKIPVLILGIDV